MKANKTMAAIAIAVCTFFGGFIVTEHAIAKAPLLGSKDFSGPYGAGFGSVKPKRIYNGGVSSGEVHNIRWRRWGKRVAFGVGLGHQYKPQGGYYSKHVRVRFRARRLGYCGNSNRLAYTRLWVRIQKKPGGRFTKWFNWSGSRTICEW